MVKNDIYFWGISKENVLLWKDAAKKKKKKKKKKCTDAPNVQNKPRVS